MWDEVIDAERWSEGALTEAFEAAWAASNGLAGVAFGSWSGAALAALAFAGSGASRALPVEHLHGDAARDRWPPAREVEFVDCNRDDLCMSFEDFERKAEAHRPKAAFLVHIGGHIAFEVEQIADYCRRRGSS